MAKRRITDAEKQAYFLTRKVDRAIRDHNMIEPGDRIMVGVSGGKDSFALARLLHYRLRSAPIKYEIVAAHVRGDARGAEIDVPESFVEWFKTEGVPLHVRDIYLPEGEPLPMPCERCARNRRRTPFEMADEHGCNKLALAHHLEDFAHTALMNLLQHGRMETMSYASDYFGGKFTLIRPIAYIRERDIVRFGKVCGFPIVESDCPMASLSRRQSATDLMRSISREFRWATVNIVRAASPSAVPPEEEESDD